MTFKVVICLIVFVSFVFSASSMQKENESRRSNNPYTSLYMSDPEDSDGDIKKEKDYKETTQEECVEYIKNNYGNDFVHKIIEHRYVRFDKNTLESFGYVYKGFSTNKVEASYGDIKSEIEYWLTIKDKERIVKYLFRSTQAVTKNIRNKLNQGFVKHCLRQGLKEKNFCFSTIQVRNDFEPIMKAVIYSLINEECIKNPYESNNLMEIKDYK